MPIVSWMRRSDSTPLLSRIALIVFGFAGVAGLAVLVTKAVSKVGQGRGTETYKTVWGVEFSWIGLLILLAAAALALAVGLLLRWREDRRWQKLEEEVNRMAK